MHKQFIKATALAGIALFGALPSHGATSYMATEAFVRNAVSNEASRVDAMVAAPYSASAIYAEGDHCIYTGVLYRCKSTKLPGRWDSFYWTPTTLDAVKVDAVAKSTLTGLERYSDISTFGAIRWVYDKSVAGGQLSVSNILYGLSATVQNGGATTVFNDSWGMEVFPNPDKWHYGVRMTERGGAQRESLLTIYIDNSKVEFETLTETIDRETSGIAESVSAVASLTNSLIAATNNLAATKVDADKKPVLSGEKSITPEQLFGKIQWSYDTTVPGGSLTVKSLEYADLVVTVTNGESGVVSNSACRLSVFSRQGNRHYYVDMEDISASLSARIQLDIEDQYETLDESIARGIEGKGCLTTNDVDKTLSKTGKPADAKATGDALAAKRDKTDRTIDPDFWVLVNPDGTKVVLGWDVAVGCWAGGEDYYLEFTSSVGLWTLVVGDTVMVGSEAPADSTGLVFENGTDVYRLYRATELATNADLAKGLEGKQDALSAAQLANIAAVPGKADSADLRYRIADAAVRKTLPADCFPVTFTYNGDSYSASSLVNESEASAAGDMFITDNGDSYSIAMVLSPGTGSEAAQLLDVAYLDAGGVFESSGIQDLQFGGVSPVANTSPALADIQVIADRTVNLITATDETSIEIAFPTPQEGYSRDFYVGIVASGTAPTLTLPTDITLVTTIPELSPNATNIIRFTEVNTNAFVAVNISQNGPLLAKVSYAELVAAANGGLLTPGKEYQITNYVATTTQSDTQSANHPFDIIVTAISTNALSEEAKATLHAGDTYFPGGNCNLAAWKVWYSIDNDTKRFAWADATYGKGVIYRLIDEYGNDVPYDFKGIMFQKKIPFYDTSGVATQTNNIWCYTFDGGWSQQGARRQMDFSIDDTGYSNFIFGNKIRPYIVEVTSGGYYLQQKLNDIVSLGDKVEENFFDEGCHDIILGQKNSSSANVITNNFGKGCFANEFGAFFIGNEVKSYVNLCRYVFTGTPSAEALRTSLNTIGVACSGIVLSRHNSLNTIENGCMDITFADNVRNVNIANSSKRITIGHDSSGIKIGAFVEDVNLGFACYGLEIGTYVQSVNIGNSSNGLWQYITIAPGVHYLDITKSDLNNYGQNISVQSGTYGTASNHGTITVEVNTPYHVEYRPQNSQVLEVPIP